MEETTELIGFEKLMKTMAENGLRNQVEKESDYIDDNGMLICGVCHKPRQMLRELDVSSEECERKVYIKTTCECDCDKAKKAEIDDRIEKQKKAEKLKWRRGYSTIEGKYLDATFDNYQQIGKCDNFNIVKNYAVKFIDMCDGKIKAMPRNTGLRLYGSVGTGKTYAAACIANYLMENGKTVYMTTITRILEQIQGNMTAEAEIVKKITHADLVIFDDVGAERNTSYATEKVFNYIDARYKANKPMIITTNLSNFDWSSAEELTYRRIIDRIDEVCLPIEFKGQSRRVVSGKNILEILKKEQ